MSDDYGKRVSMALRAVRQLFEDTSRLLSDCDGAVGKGKSLATRSANATYGTSYSLGRPWLIEGAYRYYAVDPVGRPGLAEGVCVCFLGEAVAAEEPALIVGRLDYRLPEGSKLQDDICKGFDLWLLMANDCDPIRLNEILSGGPAMRDDRIVERFSLIAVPLYSIKSVDDVAALLDRVRTVGD